MRGITFECSRAGAVLIKDGTHDEIAGCTIRNLGDTAIDIQGGTHHLVRSCDVYEVAATGISVEGGDRKTLVRGEHAVENCDIHHYARMQKTYKPAVQLGGVGQHKRANPRDKGPVLDHLSASAMDFHLDHCVQPVLDRVGKLAGTRSATRRPPRGDSAISPATTRSTRKARRLPKSTGSSWPGPATWRSIPRR